ncbi:MAG TPA: hypothetical protein VNM90_30005 [Haliangium sp.]|nr:hypothetical protein [Haliangium sp.]
MASWDHEGIIELFRNDPRLAPELLQSPLGVPIPAFSEARIESGTMTDHHPPEIRADLVVTLHRGTRPVLGIIVEAQRKRNAEKLYAWPAYVGLLRRNLRADACVLVVTQSEQVARWASKPIVTGPGGSLKPLVMGPSVVPIVRDIEEARREPELAVLSAMVHGGGDVETAVQVALAASTAAHALDRDRFLLYFGLVRAALSEAARKAFEMDPQGSQLYDESQRKSFNKGKATAVLAFLEARGLPVTEAQRKRIVSCTDLETLDRWTRRAATISSTKELFR